MERLTKTHLDIHYEDRLSPRPGRLMKVSKKPLSKLGSGIIINNPDSDSAKLSIREESLAKKKYFSIQLEIDEAINIVSTVVSSIDSVSQILKTATKLKKETFSNSKEKYQNFLNSEFKALLNNLEQIKIQTKFQDELLVDGSFYREINLLQDDEKIIIDFRNPVHKGIELSSIDFSINNELIEGSLNTGLNQALNRTNLQELSHQDLETITKNLIRMQKHAIVTKQRLLMKYKELDKLTSTNFESHNYDSEKAILFISNYQKELQNNSASTMLSQISDDQHGAIGLLP